MSSVYEWYKSYDNLYHGSSIPEDRAQLLLKLVEGIQAKRILDVGCGDGSLTIRFRDKLAASETVGLEISEDGVSIAQGRGVDARVVNLDTDVFPFENDSFDFILCAEVIEHLFDPDHLLQEMSRVLKSSGILLLTTPNIASWYDRFALLLGFQPISIPVSLGHPETGRPFGLKSNAGREHIRFFTQRALKETLLRYELTPVKALGWMKEPPKFESSAVYLVRFMNRIFSHAGRLCTTSIMVCRKTEARARPV